MWFDDFPRLSQWGGGSHFTSSNDCYLPSRRLEEGGGESDSFDVKSSDFLFEKRSVVQNIENIFPKNLSSCMFPKHGHSRNVKLFYIFYFRLPLGTTPICKPAAAEGHTNLSPPVFWSHVLYEPPTSDKTEIVLCQTLSILKIPIF
jgi:hypothetical protein